MINIKSFFSKDAIILELKATNKADALKEISHHLLENNFINNWKKILKTMQAREKQFSTGIGNGIAIPHAQDKSVIKNIILIAKSNHKIDWKSLDNKPIDLIFTIVLNKKDIDKQVDILQQLSKLMMKKTKMSCIRKLQNANDIIKFIDKETKANVYK